MSARVAAKVLLSGLLLLGCTFGGGDATSEGTLVSVRGATDILVLRTDDPLRLRELPSPLHAELTSRLERVEWTRADLSPFSSRSGDSFAVQLSGRIRSEDLAPRHTYLVVVTGRADATATQPLLRFDRVGAVIDLESKQLLDAQPGGQQTLDRLIAVADDSPLPTVMASLAEDLATGSTSALVSALEPPD